ncbi:hypothetical protein QUF55_04180, partial [Clostridiaceae bacterium HSG29]|nr:hypothetical protein [Clostridiaceae bacterium HSG29]
PLSTLKPYVTTSAPRLSTSCWLDFTGLGISPNYILHAELAHPQQYYTLKKTIAQQVFKVITLKTYHNKLFYKDIQSEPHLQKNVFIINIKNKKLRLRRIPFYFKRFFNFKVQWQLKLLSV